MDIKSPRLLIAKGVLFGSLGCLAGGILLAPNFSWTNLGLFFIAMWAFCRTYYFCFYVLHHYVDPRFRYAGILSAVRYLVTGRP